MTDPASSTTEPLVWFITGSYQGFGTELVRAALQRGDSVVATTRHPEKVAAAFSGESRRPLILPQDLRSESHVTEGVETAIKHFKRIDVLVNNAADGLIGAIEESSDAEVAAAYEINVFGLLRVTRAVLPHMRKQRSGHIVNLSPIGDLVGLAGWGIYNSTRFAVEGISEALAAELAPLGIRVTIVEPGPFRIDFSGGSLAQARQELADYEKTAGKTRHYATDRNVAQPCNPARAAEAVIEAVTGESPALHP